jgi:hypothetical protein
MTTNNQFSNRRRMKWIVRSLVAVVVVGVVTGLTVPPDRLRHIMKSLAGAADGFGSEYQLNVALQYENGTRTFNYNASLTDAEVSNAQANPESARHEFITRAKQALAEQQGYGNRTFGTSNYSVLTGVNVVGITIKNPSTGREIAMALPGRRGSLDAID